MSKSSGEIFIVTDYSEKSFAVFGDTQPFVEEIKKMKGKAGRYMPLRYGKGWIFSSQSAEHKNVRQFLIKKGATLLTGKQYEKRAPKEEPEKKTRAKKPKAEEKEAPKKRAKKEVEVADEDFYSRDELEKKKVSKFLSGKRGEILSFYKSFLDKEVSFARLSDHVEEITEQDVKFDQYGVSAHVHISQMLTPQNLSMGILLARVLRPEFEGGDELLSDLEKWVKKYTPMEPAPKKAPRKKAVAKEPKEVSEKPVKKTATKKKTTVKKTTTGKKTTAPKKTTTGKKTTTPKKTATKKKTTAPKKTTTGKKTTAPKKTTGKAPMKRASSKK